MPKTATHYLISDGTLTLLLEYDEEYGGYSVTSPFDPKITTQARSMEEAFAMAHDALKSLAEAEAIPRRHAASGGNGARKKAIKGSRATHSA